MPCAPRANACVAVGPPACLCAPACSLTLLVHSRAIELANSAENHEKLGGILVINELIDIPVKENETKIIRFANCLRGVFPSPTADPDTLKLASKALGHLARAGGTMTADFVEFEVTRALEWLQNERIESRRLAAVFILREMAENAPTLFHHHIAVRPTLPPVAASSLHPRRSAGVTSHCVRARCLCSCSSTSSGSRSSTKRCKSARRPRARCRRVSRLWRSAPASTAACGTSKLSCLCFSMSVSLGLWVSGSLGLWVSGSLGLWVSMPRCLCTSVSALLCLRPCTSWCVCDGVGDCPQEPVSPGADAPDGVA